MEETGSNNTTNNQTRAANLSYSVGTTMSLAMLVSDALILARNVCWLLKVNRHQSAKIQKFWGKLSKLVIGILLFRATVAVMPFIFLILETVELTWKFGRFLFWKNKHKFAIGRSFKILQKTDELCKPFYFWITFLRFSLYTKCHKKSCHRSSQKKKIWIGKLNLPVMLQIG